MDLVKINITSHEAAHSDSITVRLVVRDLSKGYLEGTVCLPNAQGGFDILLDAKDERAIQKAGRNVGGLGIQHVKVILDSSASHAGIELNTITATHFVLGMYSEILERQGMSVAFDLPSAALKAIQRDVSFITLSRIFANSATNLYHTVDLVQSYYAALEACYKEFAPSEAQEKSRLSFDLYKAGDQIFDKECVGLQAVGNSSVHQPCLGVIDYVGPGASADKVDMVLVGKGIAFDTGGNDIKGAKYMDNMRTDKSGLVYVAAATMLAAAMGANKHIRCYMPCAENMVSGSAMVPGDILSYPNGVTVEVGNTDAEGRLILADALLLACKDKPSYLLDAATLTGAAKIALGRDMCAILCRTNVIDPQISQAFDYTKEDLWLLPMREYHKRYITAKRADIANTAHGEGAPGASTAAAFLSHFVDPCIAWSHLDLSNAYQAEASPYLAAGSTGSNVYALAHWLVGAQY